MIDPYPPTFDARHALLVLFNSFSLSWVSLRKEQRGRGDETGCCAAHRTRLGGASVDNIGGFACGSTPVLDTLRNPHNCEKDTTSSC